MNTFPTISTGPKIDGFVEGYPSVAVRVAASQSGSPILIPCFTGDRKLWTEKRSFVSNTDKASVFTFYENNKDVSFYWLNEQDSVTYTVVFDGPPRATVVGDNKNLWDIEMSFIQVE